MNWQTNRAVLLARSLARRAGLTRFIGMLLKRGEYEKRFDCALIKTVQPGDIVWDVGANIGHYSVKLSEATGDFGKLYAFEPSPVNIIKLEEKLRNLKNCFILRCALGATPATLFLEQGSDNIGATSRLVNETGEGRVAVEVLTADGVLAAGMAAIPNVIKIDVEGFEREVIEGMNELLSRRSRLRAVGIEVHFGLLESRGLTSAAAEIVKKLEAENFDVFWTDSSHIIATRSSV